MKIAAGSIVLLAALALAAGFLGFGQGKKAADAPKKSPAISEPSGSSDDMASLVHSNHRLASDLYAQLSANADADENLLIAPGSTLATLASLIIGTDGETEAELRKVLDLTLSRARLEAALKERAGHLKNDVNKAETYFVGLQIEQSSPGIVRIKSVMQGTAAEQAGFQPGERIVSIRLSDAPGHVREIGSAADFVNALDDAPAAVRVRCHAAKGDETTIRTLYLARQKGRPKLPAAKWTPPLRMASALLWFQEGQEPARTFLDFVREAQGTDSYKVDMQADVRPVAKKIRIWFNEFTDREGSLPQMSLGKDLRMAHTESVVFNPHWSGSVHAMGSKELSFAVNNRKVLLPAVSLTGMFRAKSQDGMQFVELPCSGGLALTILMPADPKDMAAIEKKLTPSLWPKFLEAGDLQKTTVLVPEIDLYALQNLRGMLAKVGFGRLFAPTAAPAEKDIKSRVPDKKTVKEKASDEKEPKDKPANEKEAKAKESATLKMTAATILQQAQIRIRANKDGMPAQEPEAASALRVNFDRPFLFVVFDRRTKEILLLGRCANPRAMD